MKRSIMANFTIWYDNYALEWELMSMGRAMDIKSCIDRHELSITDICLLMGSPLEIRWVDYD